MWLCDLSNFDLPWLDRTWVTWVSSSSWKWWRSYWMKRVWCSTIGSNCRKAISNQRISSRNWIRIRARPSRMANSQHGSEHKVFISMRMNWVESSLASIAIIVATSIERNSRTNSRQGNPKSPVRIEFDRRIQSLPIVVYIHMISIVFLIFLSKFNPTY